MRENDLEYILNALGVSEELEDLLPMDKLREKLEAEAFKFNLKGKIAFESLAAAALTNKPSERPSL